MRILTIGPTGVVAMRRVLTWLAERGDEVWVVDEEATYCALLPSGFHFSLISPFKNSERAQQTATGAVHDPVAELQRISAEFRPEIVHLHNVTALGVACAQAGIGPLVLSAWGALIPLVAEPGFAFPPATPTTLAAVDAVIVDAPALVEPTRRLLKPDARVEYLPMGADTKRFCPGRTEAAMLWRTLYAIPDEAFVLLSPRMWGAFYGHQTILQAYALAYPRFAQPTRLAFVGLGDGPQALPHMAAAWDHVAQTAAAATVRWLPRIRYPEMPTLYAMSDAVINYPDKDSFAATLIEAAACQLPIITSLLPTYRGTFVEAFSTLVDPTTLEALADAMVQVVNQPPIERGALLLQARLIVEREYDDIVISQKLYQLYSELAIRP